MTDTDTDPSGDVTNQSDTARQTLRGPVAQARRHFLGTPVTLDFTRPVELGLGSPEFDPVDALPVTPEKQSPRATPELWISSPP